MIVLGYQAHTEAARAVGCATGRPNGDRDARVPQVGYLKSAGVVADAVRVLRAQGIGD